MRALSRHGPIGSIERGEVDVPHLLVDPVPADVPTRREGGEPQSFAQEPFVSPLHRRLANPWPHRVGWEQTPAIAPTVSSPDRRRTRMWKGLTCVTTFPSSTA